VSAPVQAEFFTKGFYIIMTIQYGKQSITQDDIEAVVSVLKSDWLTQGPALIRFEQKMTERVGSKYAFAVNSATSALHLACLALNVGEGDIVWTSPISFVASSNCAIFCGASVDFVDIDINTYNIDIEKLEEKLQFSEISGTLPKCVIPVHLSGRSCDMEAIHKLSQRYGFKIIEDASHALGATYKSSFVGSCKYSDVTVFSFHPVKMITTGEGGMVLTNMKAIADRIALLRSHGITRDEAFMAGPSHGPWYYEQHELGYNYRMSDIAASLGMSQLERLDEFVEIRNKIAERYDELLREAPLILPLKDAELLSSYHLYIVRVDVENSGESHKALFQKLRNRGILVNLHYIPIYRHPYYKKMGFNIDLFPASEMYYKTAISLPIYPDLTEEDQNAVVKAILSPQGYQNLF